MKAKIRLKSVIALSVAFIMLLTLFNPVDVSAASKKPYKDVTVKKVGKIGYNSIKVTKKYGVWKGIVKTKGKKKNKFEPKKAMKVKDCIKALKNDKRIGKKYVPVTKKDKKIWNKTATCGWLYAKYSAIAKKKFQARKWGVLWDTSYSNKTKVTRLRFAVISAAIKDPYTDVTKKTVHKNQWPTVMWCKAHGAYNGVYKGKKFYPKKVVLKCEFAKNLANLYGKGKIPAEYHADFSSKEPATFGWVYQITSDLCLNLVGDTFDWYDKRGEEEKINRVEASNILWAFATASKRLGRKLQW